VVLTLCSESGYIVNTARTESAKSADNERETMQLLTEDNYYEVWASNVNDYIVLWSSDYPTKANFICTCDDMDEAVEMAKLYIHCKNNEIEF
jgi:hypothetical protein